MTKLLYVTSFNKRLYDLSGRNMFESFLSIQKEGGLLLTYENKELYGYMDYIIEVIPIFLYEHELQTNFHFYNLDNDEFLHNWLKQNEDIIPVELGGIFENCDCPKRTEPLPLDKYWKRNKKHKPKCPYLGWNYRASQWFRKIAALNYALTLDYDILILLDCDIIFKKTLSIQQIEDLFDKTSVFYFLGPKRKDRNLCIEAGFIGFDLRCNGKEFLQIVIDKYTTGQFREYDRWNDADIFKKTIEENPQIPSIDLAGDTYKTDIINSKFNEYIYHNKGIHRKHGIG